MARRTAEQMSMAGGILEQILSAEGSAPLDERVAALAQLRESGLLENPAAVDRLLMECIARQQEALYGMEEKHGKLRELIESLTAPPFYPAVFLAAAEMPGVQGALVQTDGDRRVVQVGEGVALEELTPGDEVYLTHERNALVAKSLSSSSLTGEVATYSRDAGSGRMVLRSRDEEFVVLSTAALREAALKAGDEVRFSRNAGLAFEKVEPSKGEQYFLEATPSDSFDEIGGLDREIETVKRR